jgi:hypothetical protein
MQSTYERRISEATKIEGQFLSGSDKIVPVPKWIWFARFCWPLKTAATIADIAGKDERTAKRWLSGEFEPPGVVMAALIAELYKRE